MCSEVKIKDFKKIFANYDNVMTRKQLAEEGLYYRDLQALTNLGLIEKVRRGFYHWVEDGTSDIILIKKLFPDAVLCMETALFYYEYSDRVPAKRSFAIDKNASRKRFKIDYPFIKAYRVKKELLTLGVTSIEIDGYEVRIYDRERTICDIIRNVNKIDKETFNKAIQRYLKDPQKNIVNLVNYSKILKVDKKVNERIGVWL